MGKKLRNRDSRLQKILTLVPLQLHKTFLSNKYRLTEDRSLTERQDQKKVANLSEEDKICVSF